MNWPKVKNILIFLLVAVNLFLLLNILKNDYERLRIPKQIIKDTKEILAAKNIIFETDIPAKRPQLWLLGISGEKTPEEVQRQISDALTGGTVEFAGLHFKYIQNAASENELNNIKKTSEKQIYSSINKFFNKIKFSVKGYNIIDIIYNGSSAYVKCGQVINGHDLVGNNLNFVIIGDIITECSGNWLFADFTELNKINEVNVKDITGILLKYGETVSKTGKRTVIKDISIVYAADGNNNEFRPLWMITGGDGVLYYDCAYGELVDLKNFN